MDKPWFYNLRQNTNPGLSLCTMFINLRHATGHLPENITLHDLETQWKTCKYSSYFQKLHTLSGKITTKVVMKGKTKYSLYSSLFYFSSTRVWFTLRYDQWLHMFVVALDRVFFYSPWNPEHLCHNRFLTRHWTELSWFSFP